MVVIEKINKSFPGPGVNSNPLKVLNDINFHIEKNQFISIVGQSGSGKSTLLNLLGLLDSPDSGDIFLNGKSFSKLKKSQHPQYRNQYIGFVFQSHHLMNELTVLENISLPLLILGLNKREANKKAKDAANLVFTKEELQEKDILSQKPQLISGGQKQRSAIARALITEPQLLLADEPTGSLDEDWGEDVFKLLLDLRERTTIVMVTHNPILANKTDQMFGLTRGVIEKWPKFEDLRLSIDEMASKYNMTNMVCPRCRGDLEVSFIGEEEYPARVEIDICQKCFGIWLDRGEMEVIVRNHSNLVKKINLTQINQLMD